MANQILGKNAITEIRRAIENCHGAAAAIAVEAARLSEFHHVSKSRIYELTKDLRPSRKSRADKGVRTADLLEHDGLKTAVGFVTEYGLTPAEAINLARLRGLDIPIEFPTFVRYLREAGQSGKQRRLRQTPHRRFEAEAPGDMFQFDISGTKQRWLDLKTRKIQTVSSLDVSTNHPNANPSRVRVWRFNLLDDHSRRRFTKYYGVDKPNGGHVVDFLLQAYSVLGVPFKLYCDNDAIIKFGRNARATAILGKATADTGGYEVIHHLPGNARATGKVERSHQDSEQMEKLIGVLLAEGRPLTVEHLNQFAESYNAKFNDTVHSETGQTPNFRWNNTLSVVRKLDYEALRAAFLADEFTVVIHGDLTVRLKGERFQLPTGSDMPFASWIGQRVTLVFSDELDYFTVIGLDGNEYDVSKTLHAADAAGDFKQIAESRPEQIRKELKRHAKEYARGQKDNYQTGVEPAPIQHFDVQHEAVKPSVLQFPKKESFVEPEQIAAAAPVRANLVAEKYHGELLSFWDAVAEYSSQFVSIGECKSFLDSIFTDRADSIPQSRIDDALTHEAPVRTHLRAV